MPLKQRLIEQITLEGPMPVDAYMAQCLLDPLDGYYSTRPALGVDGDFITAPLISQMFGEMIGVWVAQTWLSMGSPGHFHLVEIGGGDGTLMTDILRVSERVSGLRQALQVVMVEPSEPLRAIQARHIQNALFVPSLDQIPEDKPVIVIANEVLDCLPARQYILTETGWFERCVGQENDALTFGLVPAPEGFSLSFKTDIGQVVEISTAQMRFAENLAVLLRQTTGAALLIDYGRDTEGCGDTLQALHRHQKQDPLASPGQHDLTVWADFPAVARTARTSGIAASPIISQAQFLQRLGIDTRHAALAAHNPAQADRLKRQYERLMHTDQMGSLFKVLGLGFPATLPLFGLESA